MSVGGGGGDLVGGKELRVGSNMILFLYILLLLIWHMYFLGVRILYIVSCHNYMYYVCETEKMLENVAKRSEFVYTRE